MGGLFECEPPPPPPHPTRTALTKIPSAIHRRLSLLVRITAPCPSLFSLHLRTKHVSRQTAAYCKYRNRRQLSLTYLTECGNTNRRYARMPVGLAESRLSVVDDFRGYFVAACATPQCGNPDRRCFLR